MKNNEPNELDDLLPDDLKGDIVPEIDPQKLFDEKEYSTVILGSESSSKLDGDNADYVTVLVSPKTSREEKDEALIKLKENKAQAFMVKAIQKTKKNDQKATIIAACWETGLDFSNYFPFFVDLINDEDFHVSFEAFTVIQEMESDITKEQLSEALTKLQSIENPGIYVADTIEFINNRLSA